MTGWKAKRVKLARWQWAVVGGGLALAVTGFALATINLIESFSGQSSRLLGSYATAASFIGLAVIFVVVLPTLSNKDRQRD